MERLRGERLECVECNENVFSMFLYMDERGVVTGEVDLFRKGFHLYGEPGEFMSLLGPFMGLRM